MRKEGNLAEKIIFEALKLKALKNKAGSTDHLIEKLSRLKFLRIHCRKLLRTKKRGINVVSLGWYLNNDIMKRYE